MGKPISQHDFPENGAAQCTHEDEKDIILEYLENGDDHIKDKNSDEPPNIDVDLTKDYVDKVMKKGMIFILITLLLNILLIDSVKYIKNYYADSKIRDRDEGKNDKKKLRQKLRKLSQL